MQSALRRSITEEEIRALEEDGVVCLRGVFDPDWIERMRAAVDRVLDRPSQWGANLNAEDTPGRFAIDTFMYLYDDDFRDFAIDSPLPELASACMRASTVSLMWDFFLVKEPGTPHPTNWHQDRLFNWVDGQQVLSTWCPLDVVTIESGALEYIKGSHRWNRFFEAVGADDENSESFFKGAGDDDEPGTDGGEMIPPIEENRDDYDIVHFNSEPGDCVVHHLDMVHGAPGNFTDRRRRAVCQRYTGDDATYVKRQGKFRLVPPREPGLKTGEPFPAEHDLFPRVWPRPAEIKLWDGLAVS